MSDEANRTRPAAAPVDRLSAIWRRIYDHKVVQWTVAYVAIAYGLQHGVILASESLEWPNAVARISIVLFALGLPLVATFAWYHGARAIRNFSQAELSILAALLVVGSLVFYVFVRPIQPVSAPVAQEATVIAARAAAATPKGAISVAVLPFLNLSSDKEQEFFSDGMTEEITTALAKVPDLRVVGRTSAFQFKGANKDLRSIGQALSATHLIEGSVRRAGNRLRITAQLTKADDGTHVWAEDYDRDLTDVFAIQEDIARAITSSLHMTLALRPGENLVNNRGIDPDSYQQYLRARGLVDGQGLQDLTQATALLQQLVARNPNYAPGWAILAGAYFLTGNNLAGNDARPVGELRPVVKAFLDKSESAFRRAVTLDTNNADVYNGLGLLAWAVGKPLEAAGQFEKSIAIDPIGTGLTGYALRLAMAGHVKEGLAMNTQARLVEPFLPQPATRQVTYLWLNGQNDSALALAKTLRPRDRANGLARVYASMGQFREAAEALKEWPQGTDGYDGAQQAMRILRTDRANIDVAKLPRLPADFDYVYLYAGVPERVMDNPERRIALGYLGGTALSQVWHPSYSAVRKTARFQAYVRSAGFIDLWRAKGWPPQCHPTTGDDFECS